MLHHYPEPPSTAISHKFSLVRRLAQRIFPFIGVELRTCACKELTSSLLMNLGNPMVGMSFCYQIYRCFAHCMNYKM